ncbi:hypothetical protein J2T11_001076 [Paenarthrobacter nicotinovorans]|uniref:hypothetical protein n=1 Tax=Paenarthrobacter nicotinovorans TaxID=29320 RepID=UPI00277E985B|nr:hypothetical protein [Paenarthrobacter nicotinovorans]MDP9934736.1 hypothetical protein [Paenarthrobacter nicotinovorans]
MDVDAAGSYENPLRKLEDGGLGFCYDFDPEIFAGALGVTHGPLLVGLDTNAILEIQNYGVRLIDDEAIDHPDPAHRRDILALGEVLELWFTRDIRFVVLPGARSDHRRQGHSEKLERLHNTFLAIEDALTFQLQDWGSEDRRFQWSRDRPDLVKQTLARIPGSLDRLLVGQSFDCGVDVFLTMDKQVLRSTSDAPPNFPNVWPPSRLMDRLKQIGHFGGGVVRHDKCPYEGRVLFPDLGKISRLLEVLE